ncbi:transketolase [Microbacterium enclense]|uniref:transketolase n=1 Tax=Microbacterium enclense TaxID=993073 RepID=UPI003F800A21
MAVSLGSDWELAVPLHWSAMDERAVNISRALVLDSVEAAAGGHAGSAMAMSPVLYMLYQKILRHSPTNPTWPGRDRFVLSCGHLSIGLYVQLHLAGYGLQVSDLKSFRQFGSITPSHPERGLTPGIEMSTGPLGQGVASAVGMAMSLTRQSALSTAGKIEDSLEAVRTVWVLASDGDMEEGVTSEASSLAGHLGLGRLNVIYDRNQISTDGNISLAMSEDVAARYTAYGWHVLHVTDVNDADSLYSAMTSARSKMTAPSLIVVDSTIAWPAPNAKGTAAAHAGPLGAEEVRLTKQRLFLPEDRSFYVPDDVARHTMLAIDRGTSLEHTWDWEATRNARSSTSIACASHAAPTSSMPEFPTFPVDGETHASTREASGRILALVARQLPEVWGGSADLGVNTFTLITGEAAFQPKSLPGDGLGRNIHFGVREHAMGAIMNGIALCGEIPYGGTFLVFSDYMRPSIRMAALMSLPLIYVWTHDSVAVGEDGPTHQPVEQIATLRAIENLDVVRPGDANETAAAWHRILALRKRPSALILSRQSLPIIAPTSSLYSDVARGAYVLHETAGGKPKVALLATGSEVELALNAGSALELHGIPNRIISMPCIEWFNEQGAAYREQVLPARLRARVSIEAGIAQGWREIVGDEGEIVSVAGYGASGPGPTLYAQKGFTVANVVARAKAAIARTSD